MTRAAAVLLLALLCAAAHAQALAPPPTPPRAQLQQRLDAQLPMDLPLVDSTGRRVHLGDYFGDRPVLLVLGYYRCPQLCGLLMHGLLQALHTGRLPRTDYRIVRVSIDPEETAAIASQRRNADLAYADFVQGTQPAPQPLQLQLLTGGPSSITTLAQAAGYHYQRTVVKDEAAARYAHPAAVIVATPSGRIARYFMGVNFDPWDLRLALVGAGDGQIGNLTDRVALLCAHIDPHLGRHTMGVLRGMQVMGGALVLLLGALWWALRSPRRLQ